MATTTEKPQSLPKPPFYNIPNINNLRDAALHDNGLTTSTGQKIRPGILFRSAEVSHLDRAGWRAVKSIGIGHVFDLRSKPEVERGWKGVTEGTNSSEPTEEDVRPSWMKDMEEEGVQRHWVPVFEESDYSPERLAERYVKYMDESEDGFVHAYEDILRHAGPAYREILTYLADLAPSSHQKEGEGKGQEKPAETGGFLSNDPGAPIPEIADMVEGEEQPKGALIHCTAGKDRTGIFFGVLFSYLGVGTEAIAEEYNLTEMGLGHIREDVVARLSQSPAFQKYIAEKVGPDAGEEEEKAKGREAALRMVGARKESMLGSLKMVERIWGGAEGYLREVVGLRDKELEGLRRALLVEVQGE
jgi:hypothetical protein